MTRLILITFLTAGTVLAQGTERPQFEVASIKPLRAPGMPGGMWIRLLPGGRINITTATLRELIAYAWDVQSYQISGGPEWLDSTRYDISAIPETRPEAGTSVKEVAAYDRRLFQSLLMDRFQLAIHTETRELPVFALTAARKDGKLGPAIRESKGDCEQPDLAKPFVLPEPGKTPDVPCGSIIILSGRVTVRGATLAQLVPTLSRLFGRSVLDQTGLTQRFDADMDWPRDAGGRLQRPDASPSPPSGDLGTSVFTAFQEQLGLRIQSQKAPVNIYVVDHAEKASENLRHRGSIDSARTRV